ncbi:hypothetical protein ACHAWT_008717 [Skeletonema menzelii]
MTTMMERTMALATALLLTTTGTTSASPNQNSSDNAVPPSRVVTHEDLFDVMLTQSQHLHDPDSSQHRHLTSLSKDDKSKTVRQNWLPISSDTEFLPNLLLSEQSRRKLGGYDASNPYSTEPFVDGMEYYDEEQQSWRKLGFIVDCQANDDEMYSQHSGDNNQYVTETGCARYLIWAAYVNENYSGNGAAEYQYYDPYYGQWDQTTCGYADGSPCTKMDCHLSSTSFSLLGFFKHKMLDDWMEQLFKHQGICRWNDDDYSFMKNARKAWPQGCTMTSATTSSGKPLYYDVKPAYSGQITVAMYIDEECVEEYYMTTDAIEGIIGNIFANAGSQHSGDGDNGGGNDYSNESLATSLNRWNSAFDFWSICHSCVAHDLDNTDGSTYYGECYDDAYYAYNNYNNDDKDAYYNAYNNMYGGNNGGRQLGGEYCPKGDAFECYDDAGYTSVNQCMKFSAKTTMRTATFRDLAMANMQGTLTTQSLAGYVNESFEFHSKTKTNAITYTFLISMSMLCACSIYYLVKIIREASRSRSAPNLTETLVANAEVA